MNIDILYILCASIVVSRDVSGFDILRELLYPRFPTITRLRHPQEARSFVDEFAVFHTIALIERSGYPYEEHSVTTEDGYNIAIFRIPGSPKSPSKTGKPVVYLQHGLLASSDTWVTVGSEHDLAFFLADVGYDVWLGNVRGNAYARSHIDLSPQDADFWQFSFHEMATRDLTSTIDYALNETGMSDLVFIGHSMGTTIGFVLLSELPEYNKKIRLFVALAPIAFWTGPTSAIMGLVSRSVDGATQYFVENNINEFGPQTTNNVRLGKIFCSESSILQPFCVRFYNIFAGYSDNQLNYTFLPTIFAYYPAGTSAGTLQHYGQNLKTGVFRKFDFGYAGNFRMYGKKKPPMYDVKKISAPVALIYGKQDAVSTGTNTMELVKRLQNVVTGDALGFDNFNHLDFLWGRNARDLMYNKIVELISAHMGPKNLDPEK